jgi:hypothetical protein
VRVLKREMIELGDFRRDLLTLKLTPTPVRGSSLSVMDLGRRSFRAMWLPGVHLDLIQEKLEAVERGEIKRLILEMPPRHAKSTMVCELFVPWYLSRNPFHHVIYTSYAAARATVWGRRARDLIEANRDILGISIRKDARDASDWFLNEGGGRGGMQSAGVGGPITGVGADLFVVDDPIKNEEDADSPVIREKTWEWWGSTAKARFEPNASVIIIMHRWRKDDLVGQILEDAKDTGEEWDVVRLPALADENDSLKRKVGEALWTNRFSQKEMEAKKRTTPPRWWNALYQQDPKNEDGAEWPEEWLTWDGIWVDEFPADPLLKVMALDPSKGKLDKPGDYSAYTFLSVGRDDVLYLGADLDNRRSAEKIVSDGLDWVRAFAPDGFAIEGNAFQELFGLLFKHASERRKIPIRFAADGKDGPILKTFHNSKSKVGRIREWGKHFAAHFGGAPKPREERYREVRFVRGMRIGGGTISLNTEVMVKQFMEFPHCTVRTGGHDDGPDSAELALRMVNLFKGQASLVEKIRSGRALR